MGVLTLEIPEPYSPHSPAEFLVVLFPFRTGAELLPAPIVEPTTPVTLTGELPQRHDLPTMAGSTHCPALCVPRDVINHTVNILCGEQYVNRHYKSLQFRTPKNDKTGSKNDKTVCLFDTC